MSEDYVLTREDYLMLKRELGHLRHEQTNLRNSLATYGLRRHQAVYMPSEKLKWFSLSESLAEFGEADAYDTTFNESSLEWEEDAASSLTTLYSTVSGVTGSDGDIVLARWIKAEKKWEVLTKPAGARNMVKWDGPTVLDSAVGGNRFNTDGGNLKFGRRTGQEDGGITHDHTLTTAQTSGNFTVTRAGMYYLYIDVTAQPNYTSNTEVSLNGTLSYKRGSDPFEGMITFSSQRETEASGNFDFQNSAATIYNLEVGDKLRYGLSGNTGTGSSDYWTTELANFMYEYLGPASAPVILS